MRGINRLALAVPIFTLMTCPALEEAQALQRTVQRPIDGTFDESVNRPVPVGASAAMGAVLARSETLTDVRQLTLHFMQPFTGTVVLEMTTADGRYRGTASYKIANARAGSSEIVQFPTAQLSLLRRYNARTVAISAHSDGARTGRRYFPVSFDGAPAGAGTLQLYVMSQGAEIFFVDRVQRRLVKCDRVTGVAGVRFDTVCLAPSGNVDWVKGVSLRRQRGTSQLPSITIAF